MISKKIFHEKIAEKKCYGSHGLVVMGGVSCSEGRGFEKEAGDGPFKKRFTEGAPEDWIANLDSPLPEVSKVWKIFLQELINLSAEGEVEQRKRYLGKGLKINLWCFTCEIFEVPMGRYATVVAVAAAMAAQK